MMMGDFALPQLSLRFLPIWQRHWLVWKKIAAASVIGHLADPVIYMLGLGYGFIHDLSRGGNGVLQHDEQRQL